MHVLTSNRSMSAWIYQECWFITKNRGRCDLMKNSGPNSETNVLPRSKILQRRLDDLRNNVSNAKQLKQNRKSLGAMGSSLKREANETKEKGNKIWTTHSQREYKTAEDDQATDKEDAYWHISVPVHARNCTSNCTWLCQHPHVHAHLIPYPQAMVQRPSRFD
jgi:hypothetical protein